MSTQQTYSRLVERPGAYVTLLFTAFDQVCNVFDSRGPIDALVPWEAANVYMDAIEYMKAGPVKAERVVKGGETWCHLTAPGIVSPE
jgi:hypothetical protein